MVDGPGRGLRPFAQLAGVNTALVHLDPAGAALPSPATVAAQVAHLRREGEVGPYLAQAEAEAVLDDARRRIGELVGGRGTDVALVESATRGFTALLAAWPLPPRARIGVTPGEYGSNRMALEAGARAGRWSLVEIPCDGSGRVALDALDGALDGLGLVTFPHVPSQRGIAQPAAEIARRCRAAGVAVLLDVAQTAGHLDLATIGADAWVGTSRKWLRGPRGVGFVALRPGLADELTPPWPTLSTATWDDCGGAPRPVQGAARFEPGEAPIAARVGLAAALAELAAKGLHVVAARTRALGQAARHRLHGAGGWEVIEPLDEPTGTVTLRHASRHPSDVHAALLDRGIVTSCVPVARAPLDLSRPVLRASFHGGYAGDDDAERLATALEGLSAVG